MKPNLARPAKRKAAKIKLDSDSDSDNEDQASKWGVSKVEDSDNGTEAMNDVENPEDDAMEQQPSAVLVVEQPISTLIPSHTSSTPIPSTSDEILPSRPTTLSSPPISVSQPPSPESSAYLPLLPTVPAREITVRSTFDALMLWSPDDLVDPGRDEYCRAFQKGGWVELAERLAESEEED